jgi:hypothetical protein
VLEQGANDVSTQRAAYHRQTFGALTEVKVMRHSKFHGTSGGSVLVRPWTYIIPRRRRRRQHTADVRSPIACDRGKAGHWSQCLACYPRCRVSAQHHLKVCRDAGNTGVADICRNYGSSLVDFTFNFADSEGRHFATRIQRHCMPSCFAW